MGKVSVCYKGVKVAEDNKKRETVGKISSDLIVKAPDSQDPIEIEREMHKDYEKEIFTCIKDHLKVFNDSFYVMVITKKEPLMQNVMRNYFFARQSCPTPDYDQTVYKYHWKEDALEFMWVIPSKDACLYFLENALLIDEEEKDLLNFVMQFASGDLFRLAKKLNNEEYTSPLIIES